MVFTMLPDFTKQLHETLSQQIINYYNNDDAGNKDIGALIKAFCHHPANFNYRLIADNVLYMVYKIRKKNIRLEMLEQVIKLDPNNVYHLTRCAKILADDGQFTKSFEIFRRSLNLKKGDIITLTSYAKALADNGQFSEAFKKFERSLEYGSNDIVTLTSYAKALADNGQFPKSFQIFERSLKHESNNTTTLTSYAKALADNGQFPEAFEKFECSLKYEGNNTVTLNSYAKALADNNQLSASFEKFKRSLKYKGNNTVTLNSYAKALADNGQFPESFEIFEHSLQHKGNNTVTLTSYAKALADNGQFSEAFEKFEHSLEYENKNIVTLNSYAKALADNGQFPESFEKFERSLKYKGKNTVTLNSYAKTLANNGQFSESFEIFERSLEYEGNNTVTLNSYARALIQNKLFSKAFEILEKSQKLDPQNPIILATYAVALATCGYTPAALEKFAQANQLDPNNILTLTNYGKALVQAEKYIEALALFKKVLEISQNDKIALWLTANTLQILKQPNEAVEMLKRIKLQDSNSDYLIRLSLGRLYFQLGRKTEGREQFDQILRHSANSDETSLHMAMNLMTSDPYSHEANSLLQQIVESSSSYKQARRMLSLNLDSKSHFDLFSMDTTGQIKDRAQINRTLYHKIKNRIAVLKETLYERLLDSNDIALHDLLKDIDLIFSGIKQRRTEESLQTEKLGDYSEIIRVISATAHDIVDFVGNKISAMREKMWEYQDDLSSDDTRENALYNEVKQDLQRTLSTLNDLKTVNEGMLFKKSTTDIQTLFETWLNLPSLGHAEIDVKLDAPSEKIATDVEKIRGFLDELVENSLKHNPNNPDLQIKLRAELRTGLPLYEDGRVIRVPTQDRYLHISVADNGSGIVKDQKKETRWIFHPLTTTAQDNEGSGLGLFGIHRTLTHMNGFIEENGTDGANFDIYILLG